MKKSIFKYAKFFKGAVALAMLLVTIFGVQMSVSADTHESTEKAPKIIKTLETPEGVAIPALTFNYTYDKIDFNGDGSDDTKNRMPVLSSNSITFTATDVMTVESDKGIKSLTKNSDVSIPSTGTFQNAGVYTYKVTEAKDNNSIVTGESIEYSESEYELKIYVKNDKDNGGTVISNYTVYQIKDDKGEIITENNGEGVPVPKPAKSQNLVFKNEYRRNAGPEIDGKYTSLVLTKEVDKGWESVDLDTKFKFDIYFKLSDMVIGDAKTNKYTGAIIHKSGSVPQKTEVSGIEINDPTKPFTVELKHGETFELYDLPGGTKIYVIESAKTDFTGNADITSANSSGTYDANPLKVTGTKNTDFLINRGQEESNKFDIILGNLDNKVEVKNDYAVPSITGVVLNNLPFIALIVIGLGGLGFIIVNRKRKEVH